MTDFHGVFPYLVSPVDGESRIKSGVLGWIDELCRARQWRQAMELRRAPWRINEIFARFSLAACIKAALQLQGYAVGDPIPPQRPLSADERRVVAAALSAVAAAGGTMPA